MEPSNKEARELLASLCLSKITHDALFQNGKLDCENGVDHDAGWKEIAKKCGLSTGRTPAQEAYLDGYYSTTFNKNNKEKAS